MHLFDPMPLRGLRLRNRIVVSPMCQYSADRGCATDWHLVHWGQMLLSGAGMFTIEATAVTAEGRITHGCLGLYDAATERALGSTIARARGQAPSMPVAIQLAHAGRKARRRAVGRRKADPAVGGRLDAGCAVAVPHADGELAPHALDAVGLVEVRDAFGGSTKRAESAAASTRSSCTWRTGICCTNSCRRSRTGAAMRTEATLRTASAFRSKSSMRCAPRGAQTGRSACAFRRPIGCRRLVARRIDRIGA